MNSDQDIVESTPRLPQIARSRVPWYADDFASVCMDQLHELAVATIGFRVLVCCGPWEEERDSDGSSAAGRRLTSAWG